MSVEEAPVKKSRAAASTGTATKTAAKPRTRTTAAKAGEAESSGDEAPKKRTRTVKAAEDGTAPKAEKPASRVAQAEPVQVPPPARQAAEASPQAEPTYQGRRALESSMQEQRREPEPMRTPQQQQQQPSNSGGPSQGPYNGTQQGGQQPRDGGNSSSRRRRRSKAGGPSGGYDGQQGGQRPGGQQHSHQQRHGSGQGGYQFRYESQAFQQQIRNAAPPVITIQELNEKTDEEVLELARSLEIPNLSRMPRSEMQINILRAYVEQEEGSVFGDGVLEIIEDGFGFLRGARYLPAPDDVYVSQSQIRRFGLRTGDRVCGQARAPKDNEKFASLIRVEAVNGIDPETARRRPSFDNLTPIFPLEMINLETQPNILSTRMLNLVAPIGRGQRGLIVSPPKAGKTMLLKSIANGISTNSPDIHLMVCLIGERPEEVTDMRRSIDGEVIYSTFDEPVEDHAKVAEMALERAKRLVEGGRDVVILLDSITRLARAYNLAVPPSGRTLSGGMDPVALYPPKRFFGAARNIEGGGSLTVVSTCLIDTGSRMDDVIYEEFKGTGNMELHLDRKLAERRIYPAIDVQRSGTRREELLLGEHDLKQVWTMRRMVSMLGGSEGTELLLGRLAKTQTNAEFLETLTKDV